MKTRKSASSEARRKSSGTKLVEKYRRRMSRLSDVERQKLMARELQIIYGDTAAAQSAHRGDTNVPLDLADEKEHALDALEVVRRRLKPGRILVTPTWSG